MPTPTVSPVINKRKSFLRIGLGRPASENDVPLVKKDIDNENQTEGVSKARTTDSVPEATRHLSIPGRSQSSSTLPTSDQGSSSSLGSLQQLDEVVFGYNSGPVPPYEADDGMAPRDRW